MIKNKGVINAFEKFIIPLSYKSFLRVLLPQTAEIRTVAKSYIQNAKTHIFA